MKERPFPFPHVSKLNLNLHFSRNVMQSAVPTTSVISYVPLPRCINWKPFSQSVFLYLNSLILQLMCHNIVKSSKIQYRPGSLQFFGNRDSIADTICNDKRSSPLPILTENSNGHFVPAILYPSLLRISSVVADKLQFCFAEQYFSLINFPCLKAVVLGFFARKKLQVNTCMNSYPPLCHLG